MDTEISLFSLSFHKKKLSGGKNKISINFVSAFSFFPQNCLFLSWEDEPPTKRNETGRFDAPSPFRIWKGTPLANEEAF